MGDYYPADRSEVTKNGVRGVMATGAGLGVLVFNSLLGIPLVGPILGGALVVLGVIGVVGRTKNDKVTGTVLIGAGVLGLASFVLKGLTSFLLGAGGFVLIGLGLFSLYKFVKGLKSRA